MGTIRNLDPLDRLTHHHQLKKLSSSILHLQLTIFIRVSCGKLDITFFFFTNPTSTL